MGFDFDKFQSSTGRFVSAPEKKALADNGIPFTILAMRQVHKFDNENYELTINMPDPETGENEERVLSFPIGSGAESRDAMLAAMAEHLDANAGEAIEAKLEKVGRGYYLRAA